MELRYGCCVTRTRAGRGSRCTGTEKSLRYRLAPVDHEGWPNGESSSLSPAVSWSWRRDKVESAVARVIAVRWRCYAETNKATMVTSEYEMAKRHMLTLCYRALHGDLGLDELTLEFPSGAPEDPYLSVVYGDLVDGVEHFPAALTGKPDYSTWRTSEMYANLSLHILLLEGPEEARDLLRLYDILRVHLPASGERLAKLLTGAREALARERGNS